jgi:hypothetical protein
VFAGDESVNQQSAVSSQHSALSIQHSAVIPAQSCSEVLLGLQRVEGSLLQFTVFGIDPAAAVECRREPALR